MLMLLLSCYSPHYHCYIVLLLSLVLVAQLIVLSPSMVAAPGSPLAASGFD